MNQLGQCDKCGMGMHDDCYHDDCRCMTCLISDKDPSDDPEAVDDEGMLCWVDDVIQDSKEP